MRANTLDLVGDRWSLPVVRDLVHGKETYGELLDSPEGIPTNILADRLRRLEDAGLIASSPYQQRPVRYAYSLTEKGTELGGILLALVQWGKRHIPGTRTYKDSEASARYSKSGRSHSGALKTSPYKLIACDQVARAAGKQHPTNRIQARLCLRGSQIFS
jgi:DNA-binding HxlR family transcriptional regulator